MTPGGREPFSAERAAAAVVPASTTCSRPARVIRSCWLDTVCSLTVGLMIGIPVTRCYRQAAVSRARVFPAELGSATAGTIIPAFGGLGDQPGAAQRVGERAVLGFVSVALATATGRAT